jgi:hypothetical protein
VIIYQIQYITKFKSNVSEVQDKIDHGFPQTLYHQRLKFIEILSILELLSFFSFFLSFALSLVFSHNQFFYDHLSNSISYKISVSEVQD